MRVLHITNNYPTINNPIYGIFVREQIESLASQGVENEIFFINGRENGKMEYLKSVFRLRRLLKINNFDILHCHHALSAICLILTGKSKAFKVIVSYQNDPMNEQGQGIYKFIRKHTHAIILKNNSSIIDERSVFYQPNGVNTNFFKDIDKEVCFEKLKLNNHKRYILFVSSNFVRAQKRHDRFQKVIEILKDKYKLYDIEELQLINIERNIVPYYFNASSLHLLSSDFEGSPNSVKEAMACNIPVVATDVGNVRELLSEVDGSYVSNSIDAEELASLAYMALNNNNIINGRTILIEKKLDIDSVAKNIVSIYKKIINE